MERKENTDAVEVEYLIIGAGPAGLQLGYFFEQAGRDYLILEAGSSPGSFFKTFPRHRTLISSNKVHTGVSNAETNLRWDWNSLLAEGDGLLFKDYTSKYFPPADVLVQYLGDYAERFKLKIKLDTRVSRIRKDGRFVVTDSDGGVYSAERLIVATGISKPYLPPIPGIELTENYTEVSVDPADFTNQKVLILGKGNSAFETADNLIETAAVIHVASPEPLKLAWKTHFVGHLRAVNNNFLDTYQLKSQNAVLDATIEKIERRGQRYVVSVSYTHAQGEREELTYDRVIACTGFRFDASIFDASCSPELTINDRFPKQTSEWASSNVEGLYFVGALTQMRDFKRGTSGFIHGFRYNARSLFRLLERKYHRREWPARTISATPQGIVEAVVGRINASSVLWQQFGFLGDLVVVPEQGGEARYYEEMPVDFIRDSEFGTNSHYYVVTLEFGKILGDPFNVERHPDPSAARQSTFLHPVVRRYAGGRLLAEHHLLEDLDGVWVKEDVHLRPLTEFISGEFSGAACAAGLAASSYDFDRSRL